MLHCTSLLWTFGFFGIVIKIYWNDHGPPHFHAKYGKYEASFDIQNTKKREGKLPKNAERIVNDWARQHKKELLECWELIKGQKPFDKIKGADK